MELSPWFSMKPERVIDEQLSVVRKWREYKEFERVSEYARVSGSKGGRELQENRENSNQSMWRKSFTLLSLQWDTAMS